METAIKPMIPYVVVLTVAILIVAFVPWFSTALPRLLDLA
jgi:TRAP-type C4-dicarboxylate transport system permease large subunit